jgi:Tol biopolymer transport system component
MSPFARAVLVLGVFLLAPAAAAHAQLSPDLRWRTFDTEHFRVHFAEGLEDVARRAAPRAERAYALLSREFVAPPAGRIDMVIADNVDFSNGTASPIPRNRIVIYANPPVGEASLSFFDDWLELVITHELAHIFHLDHASGLWLRLRSVFGRSPPLFPQFLQPGWFIEGLATYFESRLTGAGRVRGTMHEMALRTAVLDGRFFDIDQVTGDPLTWPGASVRYVYGSMFVEFLSHRFGPERTARLVEHLGAGLVPYRLDAAARATYGVPFTQAWQMWHDSLTTRYALLADSLQAQGMTVPEILVEEGGHAAYPRYAPDGSIAFIADTRAERPAIRTVRPGGTAQTLARLNWASSLAWAADGEAVLFSELDFHGPYRIYADLYRADRHGHRTRITRGARVAEMHPHPQGRYAVAIANVPGTNTLVSVDLETGEQRQLIEPSLDVHWSQPRWSPDGRSIAVSQWRTGGFFAVVVLDSVGTRRYEVTDDRAIDTAPAWSPDGRYLVFSSDRTGIANLFAYDHEAGRLFQVTNVLTGAFHPDVSPDGRSIVFSYYGAEGYRIARVPFAPETWTPAPPVRPEIAAYDEQRFEELRRQPTGAADRPYSAWPSLLPTSWTPLVFGDEALGTALGVILEGSDVIERHLWSSEAMLFTEAVRLDGRFAYRYRGLGVPLLDASASQRWTVLRARGTLQGPDGQPIPAAVLRQTRAAQLGTTFLRPRLRGSSWLATAAVWEQRRNVWDDPDAAGEIRLREVPPDVGGLAEVGYSTVRSYALTIGPRDGFAVSARAEGRREVRPFEPGETPRGYGRFVGRLRGYQGFPGAGFAPHVLAVRTDFGATVGRRAPGLEVGGTTGERLPVPFGTDFLAEAAAFPIRGYPRGVQVGNRAALASAEYRLPVSLIERGIGVLPLFFSRLSANGFLDAGSAWCQGDCEGIGPGEATGFQPLVSTGAETTLELTVGFHGAIALRAGVAVPLTPVEAAGVTERPRPQLYLRAGRSF